MATKNKNRVRNRIINFRVTPSEYEEIQARIKVCGMPKGEYFIQSLLHQNICISVGKYQRSIKQFCTMGCGHQLRCGDR